MLQATKSPKTNSKFSYSRQCQADQVNFHRTKGKMANLTLQQLSETLLAVQINNTRIIKTDYRCQRWIIQWIARLNWIQRWVSKSATSVQSSRINSVLRNWYNNSNCCMVHVNVMIISRPRLLQKNGRSKRTHYRKQTKSQLLVALTGDNHSTLLVSSWKFLWLAQDARVRHTIRSSNECESNNSCNIKTLVRIPQFLASTQATPLR